MACLACLEGIRAAPRPSRPGSGSGTLAQLHGRLADRGLSFPSREMEHATGLGWWQWLSAATSVPGPGSPVPRKARIPLVPPLGEVIGELDLDQRSPRHQVEELGAGAGLKRPLRVIQGTGPALLGEALTEHRLAPSPVPEPRPRAGEHLGGDRSGLGGPAQLDLGAPEAGDHMEKLQGPTVALLVIAQIEGRSPRPRARFLKR